MTGLKVRLGNHSTRSTWTAESRYENSANTGRRAWVFAAGAAVILHAALVVALLTSPPTKKISLISPSAAPASVRVTILPPPSPEPELVAKEPDVPPPPEPQVLTSDTAERTVATPLPAPAPVSEPPKVKPKPKPTPPKIKPIATPVKPQKPTPPQPPTAEMVKEEPTDAPPQARSSRPTSAAEKTLSPSASGPKDVASVGCRVPSPEYPRKAKRLRIEGETLISLVVNADGKIAKADVARSSGDGELDASARAAVLGASCTPYIENGQAVAVRAVQPISFRLIR